MTARRNVIVAIVLCALAVLFFLWHRARPAVPLTVSLEAARTSIGPGESVELHAVIKPADRLVDYQWSVAGGYIEGQGAKVIYNSPQAAGDQVVTVSVSDRKSGKVKKAHVTLRVVDYRDMAADTSNAPNPSAPGAYQIKSVKLEKTSFCMNEDVKVTVDAVDPAGDTRWLGVTVHMPGGAEGDGFPESIARVGRIYPDAKQDYPSEVEVQLHDIRYGGMVTSTTVPIEVRDCSESSRVFLKCGLAGNAEDTVLCTVKDGYWSKLDFTPVSYEWFVLTDKSGDYPVSNESPVFRWEPPVPYPDRAVIDNIFMVRVHGPDGQVAEGRASVTMPNVYFLQKHNLGNMLLLARFTVPHVDGKVTYLEVTVANPNNEAVAIDRAELIETPCDAPQDFLGKPREVPLDFLPTRTFLAGARTTFRFELPTDVQRCGARVDLFGHGAQSNLTAKVAWLMPLDLRGGGDRGWQADDKEMARMSKAMQILSKRRGRRVEEVTRAEMEDLVAEGVLESEGEWSTFSKGAVVMPKHPLFGSGYEPLPPPALDPNAPAPSP